MLRKNSPISFLFSLYHGFACFRAIACISPILTFFSILVLASSSVFAQAPTGPIESVEYEGLKRISTVFVEDIANIKAGEQADKTVLDAAVDRLLRTGRFLSVTHEVQAGATGVRVVFKLRERPIVSKIRFEGLSKYRAGQLKDVMTIKEGEPVDMFAVRDGERSIEARYKGDGYQDVKVSFDEKKLEETGELVYTIVEGKRTRIRKIDFTGNKTFKRGTLYRKIRSRTALWIFRTGEFDKDQVDGDDSRIESFYRDEGFLDAKASHATSPFKESGDLRLTFTVEEGIRYSIESIDFLNSTVFTIDELNSMLTSKVGDIVKQPKVDADARTIQTRLGELGYIDSRVKPIRVFSTTPQLVRLTFEITEGEQFRVGDVVVRGNEKTKDKVVRRALNLYPPDDLFNMTEARDAEKRLRESRIFSAARVVPVGNKPGVRDAVVDVTESDKSGDFIFGFGITSNNGAIGQIVLDLPNFDLFDTPRSFQEFIKFRSFFGAGQRLRLELQPGTEVSRARVDFTEPYLFDRPLRFDTSLYLFERGRDGYDEERAGSSVSLGKRFERGLMQGWSGEIALRGEVVSIDDVDLLASNEIREDEGDNFLTAVKGTLLLDRTDNRLIPTSGDRFRVAYEQIGLLGGDHHFGKITSSYSWYKTMGIDARERKSVLELRIEGGQIVGDAPVFERFYAGGVGSIRGFEFRGVGPRDGIDRNNVGGDNLLLWGAEYTFPLYEEMVRGLFFLDAGTVDFEQMRSAIGAGVRLTLDIFGPIPIELALGFPMTEDDEDDEQVFSFSIGLSN